MAYNRFRRKEKNRRQYTFTKTKAAVGLFLSCFFSIMLSAYFEHYGMEFVQHLKSLVVSTADAASQGVAHQKARGALRYNHHPVHSNHSTTSTHRP